MRRLVLSVLLLLLSNFVLAEVHDSFCAEAAIDTACMETAISWPIHEGHVLSSGNTHSDSDCSSWTCHFGHCSTLKSEHGILLAGLDPKALRFRYSIDPPVYSLFRLERPPRA